MNLNYEEGATLLKALSDVNRLKIIDILSCGEKCACDILKHFDFTQPTLSHHMKILMNSGLVVCRKSGLWSHYSLNEEVCQSLLGFMSTITTKKENCICMTDTKEECS